MPCPARDPYLPQGLLLLAGFPISSVFPPRRMTSIVHGVWLVLPFALSGHIKEAPAELTPLHHGIKKPVSYYHFSVLYSGERNCPQNLLWGGGILEMRKYSLLLWLGPFKAFPDRGTDAEGIYHGGFMLGFESQPPHLIIV